MLTIWSFVGVFCVRPAIASSPAAPTVEYAWSMGDGKHLRILFSEAMEPGAACCAANYTMGPETEITNVAMVGERCVEVTVDRLPTDYRARISMKGLTDATPARSPLDGGSGVVVAANGSGVSYPMLLTPEGTLLNAIGNDGYGRLLKGAAVLDDAGPFGGPALVLDGGSSYVDVPGEMDLGNGDFTIMFWLKPEGTAEATVLAKSGWFGGWRVSTSGSERSGALRLGDRVCRTAAGALAPRTWTHLAFVRREEHTFAYVNGQPSGARCNMDMTRAGSLSNSYPLRIGYGGHKGDGYWQGQLAHVKILAHALTIGEIREAGRFHGGMPAPDGTYRCLFNHGLLKAATSSNNTAEQFKAYVRKLEHTDVDAIMCGPQMWRTNLFRSDVDQTWKAYKPGQPVSSFAPWNGMMTYLHAGGDPVKDTLEACRECGKAFFITYRMNDAQHTEDVEWPCHNDFWRDHTEYWLGSGEGDRVHNYMLPQVRDYYFAILEEMCTDYDVDGLELDFQRSPRFFRDGEIAKGTPVMTAFVKRIRGMLGRIGKERGKALKLCVRVPHTIAGCEAVGLDVVGWDAGGLIDMINVSPSKVLTLEIGIEEFKARTTRAKIYGEMLHITSQPADGRSDKRCTTVDDYRDAALNFFARGVDALSFYNFYYGTESPSKVLEGITHVDYLETLTNQER